MELLKRFYRFFMRHRIAYLVGFFVLFLLLGWFARSVATGWWVVAAFWIYFFLKIDQVLKAVWCVIRLKSGKWIKKIKVASEL